MKNISHILYLHYLYCDIIKYEKKESEIISLPPKIKLEWKKKKKVVARFISCLTLYWPDGTFISSTGIVEGRISEIKKGTNGFGYDPIFIPLGYKKTFGELNPKIKHSISHRNIAFQKLIEKFNFSN